MKRLRSFLFLLILTATLGVTCHAAAGELDEIYRLTDEKKLDQAMRKLDAFLKEHPKDPEARFLQGLIFTGKSQSEDAIRVFRELGNDFPDLPEPFNNLAVLHAERGDYENARQALLNAIRILPDYATAHENLGDVYAKLASQSYAQALRVNSSNNVVSAKLDAMKKLFGLNASGGDAVVVAKPPAKPVSEKKATAMPAAAAAAPASEPVVENVADTTIRSDADPAVRADATVAADADASTAAPEGPAQAEVERTVQAWAKTWSSRKVDDYLAFYAANFQVPEKFADRDAWKQQRRVALSAAGTIRVTLSGIKVTMNGPDRAQVTFTQSYWSSRYQDQVSKTLAMQKEGSAWKIAREY
ncbi:MAG: tetratricopeptide repeat protein [Magnetococcus sp. DMHC-8]